MFAWAIVGGLGWAFAPQLQSLWLLTTSSNEELRVAEASVYYSGCDEARAAGVAPIYRGSPGYRESMDGDSDGIACELYR